MRKANRYMWCVLVGALECTSASAHAQVTFINSCSASVDELAADLLDAAYFPLWGCSQQLIDDAWNRFSMETDAWHDYGWTDPCDVSLPMGRTFNGLNVLNYAGTDSPDCNTDADNLLFWASCYASSSIHELTPACFGSSPTSAATTYYGTLEIDPRTELRKAFFYAQAVPLRAGSVFHEARHADGWCHHTDNCAAGAGACDEEWTNGCTGFSSSSGKGAYAYTVLYDWWFAAAAQPSFTNGAIQRLMIDDANARLSSNFERDPCFRLDSSGVSIKIC